MARARVEPVENLIYVCPISIGEVEAGLLTADRPDTDKQRECRTFLYSDGLRNVINIRPNTGKVFARLLSLVLKKYPRHGAKTEKHLVSKGVDVNDLWICAVAVERNLILLTDDGMPVIRECVTELRFDNWLA